MTLAADILTGLIGILHIWILILEMFLWTKPTGLKVFRQNADKAESSKILAANQGLYNGFLAAGLLFSLILPDPSGYAFQIFFLSCVAIAGIYGGLTAGKNILYVQALPALLTLVLLALG